MSGIIENLDSLQAAAGEKINSAGNIDALESLRVEYLGKKGALTKVLQSLGSVSAEERPLIGKRANEVKTALTELIDTTREKLESLAFQARLESTSVDVTLPGQRTWRGSIHPLSQTIEQLVEISFALGFTVADGPEIEDEWHNFDALNTPKEHPARDEHDTFFLEGGLLLRSHTSPVQVRYMLNNQPPIRIVAPGRVYRRDTVDASHSPVFHQIEGLYVDENVTFGDLKYTLQQFVSQLFGKKVVLRFRPSFFPFTEPSAEVDCQCVFCSGKGCTVCKYSGWMELLGCGMVHPNVFRQVGYDPERWTGFAFGMGIDRICMNQRGIKDIRLFLESDVNFLEQF